MVSSLACTFADFIISCKFLLPAKYYYGNSGNLSKDNIIQALFLSTYLWKI